MGRLADARFPFPFRDAEKAQGAALHRDGKVQILEGGADGFTEAKVAFFRRHHDVWIQRKGDAAEGECSCPFVENEKAGCAHLWALVCALDAQDVEAREEALARTPVIPWYGLVPKRGAAEFRLGLFERDAAGQLLPLAADGPTLARIAAPDDLAILRRLETAAGGRRNLLQGGGFVDPAGPWLLAAEHRADLLPKLIATRRFVLATDPGATPLEADDGPPFTFVLAFVPAQDSPAKVAVRGRLCRGAVERDLAAVDVVTADRRPVAVLGGRVVAVDAAGAPDWIAFAAKGKEIALVPAEVPAFVARLAAGGALPRLRLPGAPEPLPCEAGHPQPKLAIRREGPALVGAVAFTYGGRDTTLESTGTLVLDLDLSRQWQRAEETERAAVASLSALEGVEQDGAALGRVLIDRSRADAIVAEALALGWQVAIDGQALRRAGTPSLRLKSGIDWFELDGGVAFDGSDEVPLETLLEAWRAGRRFVSLPDGSRGLLPAEWLARLDRLKDLASGEDGRLRFRRSQALLLEPLLDVSLRDAADRDFAALRAGLNALSGSARRVAPASFDGALRPYQEQGLAWLRNLADLGFGGCLADDMGLGKTIQALALFLSLREAPPDSWRDDEASPPRPMPILVVCPRSLLWNWRSEAARFAPALRIREHHGPDRTTDASMLTASELVLTTYGTLQRDVELLSSITFGLVLLDEAQAIKNPKSKSAQCARALIARTRLSLTGTPIENHLRDLWSQMEFLNPGLLGTEQRFLETLGDREGGASRAVLARALKPLVLRRTKEEVVPELPEKVEQTLFAPLSAEQESLYAAIRDEARRSLEREIQDEGMAKARFHVLEALLRLRQAACHPALVDPARGEAESGKLDLLVDELAQVVDGGHKALVFSQFTSFLALVGRRLETEGFTYAYLDGQTKDRASPVRRFQEDPGCPLFLISLKAGGLGLNLTAADYVFILDPWWNPAVEAQAIDRAHRIGQTKNVFAYRLVAAGTIEERILELQARKRSLADAILAADDGPLATLSEADLRMLLS